MSKRIHPIRKLYYAMLRADPDTVEKQIARHVKPLLDALEEAHKHMNHRAGMGYEPCTMCDLLAAWREAPK